jgi:peptide/nickel transport system substrate-binding protein
VTTKQPYPAFADQLSQFYLLPPKWTAEHNPAKEAMGTGPYNLKEWVKDDHLTLEAKPTYWGHEPVPFQTVIFRAVPEASSRVSGLLAGDFEIITPVQPSDFPRINSSGKATAESGPSSRVAMVNINTKRPPFDNVKVRQALNYAVDKEGLIKALFTGFKVEPSPGEMLTDAYFGFNPDLKPYPYDPDMAKKLMKDAGVNGTIDVEFWVPIGRYLLGQELTQAIAGQLEDVGIKSKINELPFSVFLDTLVKNHDGMGTLAYLTYGWPTLDADGQLTLFEWGGQYSYWENQDYVKLLDQARSMTDQNKRKDLYKQATQIMRDDAAVIFLFPQPFTFAAANSVQWQLRPDDWVRVYDMKRKG